MNDHGTYRMEGPVGPETVINGKKCLYFAGTSYFQLQSHPELIEAAITATRDYGVAGATSRTMAGTNPLLSELEMESARFWDTEDAAYLPSGYLVSLAGISALEEMGLFDRIFLDEASHYSLVDAVKTSAREVTGFRHLDPEDLRHKMKLSVRSGEKPLIATDGIFATEGILSPLDRYVDLAEQFNGIVWCDDSHGAGILGKRGRGSGEYFGIESDRLFMGATLSKAFGAYGGIIPGREDFVLRVRNSGVMSGCNAPLNAAIGASIRGIELVRDHPEMKIRLWKNARYLKESLLSLSLSGERSPVKKAPEEIPVAAFSLPGQGEDQMIQLQRALLEDGIFIQYTRYRGAGPAGLLRIVVFSTHTTSQIDHLVDGLKKHLAGTIISPTW